MKMRFTFVMLWYFWWILAVCCQDQGLSGNRAKRSGHDYELFNQKLDHFNPDDRRTWKQRFEVYSDYFYEGGPVFLRLESDSSPPLYKQKIYSHWMQEAREFDALCFSLKHRYYGDNNYTMAITSAESYQYLTVEQALADVKEFVIFIRSKYNLPSNKIVVLGALYPGYLAILSRMHYPDHIYAAYASSPIVEYELDTENEKNVKIKKSLEWADLGTSGLQCTEQVQNGFEELSQHLKTNAGRAMIKDKFNLCTTPTAVTESDQVQLLATLRKSFKLALQLDGNDPTFDVRHVCGIMVNESLGEPSKRLTVIMEQYLEINRSSCLKNDYQNTKSNKVFIEEIDRALSFNHSDCVEQIKIAEEDVKLISNSSRGPLQIQKLFKLCEIPNKFSERSKQLLFNNLIGIFSYAVQYDVTETYNVEYVCKVMTDPWIRNPVEKLGKLYQDRKQGCINYDFNKEIEGIKSMASSADMSWRYQCCSELGNIRVSNQNDSLFGNNLPLDFSENMCTALFGERLTHKRLEILQRRVKELKIKLANHRIFATQGSMDLFYRELSPKKYKEYFDTHVLIGVSQTVDEFIGEFGAWDRISEAKSAKKQRRLFLERCNLGDGTSTGRTVVRSVRNFFSRIFG